MTESTTSRTDALTDEALRDEPRQAVFSLVYRTYASQVLGYLTARGVGDPEAAMQGVFLAVLPRLDSVQGGVAGLRTLLFSVAHARMVDDHRRQSRVPVKLPLEPDLDQREDSSAETQVLERIAPQEVLGLLDGLADDQREVLSLRLVAGLTVDQSAEAMGKSAGAVKQLSIGSLSSLPAPEPTGDLARLITAAGAPADELARRRRRPFMRPTALGLALLAGMGTGIGGVAASSAVSVQAGNSFSVQDMLEDWTPSWSIRAQLPEPDFLHPAAVSSVVEVPPTPTPVVDPEPAGSHTPEPAGGQLPVAEEPQSGLPVMAAGNPPPLASNAGAGNPDSSGQGAARVYDGDGRKGPAPANPGAGQPEGADPAVPAKARTAGESDGPVRRLVEPLAEVLRPARAASGNPAGTPVDAWLQKFQR